MYKREGERDRETVYKRERERERERERKGGRMCMRERKSVCLMNLSDLNELDSDHLADLRRILRVSIICLILEGKSLFFKVKYYFSVLTLPSIESTLNCY